MARCFTSCYIFLWALSARPPQDYRGGLLRGREKPRPLISPPSPPLTPQKGNSVRRAVALLFAIIMLRSSCRWLSIRPLRGDAYASIVLPVAIDSPLAGRCLCFDRPAGGYRFAPYGAILMLRSSCQWLLTGMLTLYRLRRYSSAEMDSIRASIYGFRASP